MSASPQTLTVRVPLALRRRGGRKVILTPDGAAFAFVAASRSRADPSMVKALARAHRWKRLLEIGRYVSISDIATAEKIDRGYVGTILRLTLLAPDIIEAILDGRQPAIVALPTLLSPWPLAWERQRLDFGFAVPADLASTSPILKR